MHVFFHLEIPCTTHKTFCFLFIKVEPFVPFSSRLLKLLCFLDRSCSRCSRCHVNLSILLFSRRKYATPTMLALLTLFYFTFLACLFGACSQMVNSPRLSRSLMDTVQISWSPVWVTTHHFYFQGKMFGIFANAFLGRTSRILLLATLRVEI